MPVLRVLGDPGFKDARHLLRHRGNLLAPGAFPGHRDLLVDVRAPQRAVEPQRDRHQGGTGLHRKRRGPAHHVRLLAEEVDLDTATGDVPVGGQADQPARAQPLGEDPEPLHTAGRGEHLEPEPFPEGKEPPGQRLGLEPLGHGGELGHATGDDPRSGLVPVAHMRQREHRPAPGGERAEQPVLPLAAHVRDQPLGADHRQAEHLEPVAGVGVHARAGQGTQFLT